jgi:hypothetical protein
LDLIPQTISGHYKNFTRLNPTDFEYLIDLLGPEMNCVALVRKRTIPTERPPHIGEVSARFCG